MSNRQKGGDIVFEDAASEASSLMAATSNNGWHSVFLSTGRGGADPVRTGEKAPLY